MQNTGPFLSTERKKADCSAMQILAETTTNESPTQMSLHPPLYLPLGISQLFTPHHHRLTFAVRPAGSSVSLSPSPW